MGYGACVHSLLNSYRAPALVLALAAIACSDGATTAQPQIDATAQACGTTASERLACIERERLAADVRDFATLRQPGSEGWQRVQDTCATRLEALGFAVERVDYGTGINVIGRKEGTGEAPEEVIVSAHYDHIEGCEGADDNASGLAATLEIARVLSTVETPKTLVIACWDEEERGLIGSRAYADAAALEARNIAAMISFDGIGYYATEPNSQSIPNGFEMLFPVQVAELEARDFRGDYISLIADEESMAVATAFEEHGASVGLITSILPVPEALKLIPQTADLRRSDHASFWVHDFPGILVTDSANFRNPHYHCLDGMDAPETLDVGFITQVSQATLGAVISALGGP